MIVATELASTTHPLIDLLPPRPDDERPDAGFADLLSDLGQDVPDPAPGLLQTGAMAPVVLRADQPSPNGVAPNLRGPELKGDALPKVAEHVASDHSAPDLPALNPDADLPAQASPNLPAPPPDTPDTPDTPNAAVRLPAKAETSLLRDTAGIPLLAMSQPRPDLADNAAPLDMPGMEADAEPEQPPYQAGAAPKAGAAHKAAPGFHTPDVPPASSAPAAAAAITDHSPAALMLENTPQIEPLRATAPQAAGIHQPANIQPANIAVARQVAAAIAQVGVSGPARMVELVLAPAELGTVRMLVSGAEGNLSIQISAERPETFDLLRRNADELLRELREGGQMQVALDFSAGNRAFGGLPGQNPTPADMALKAEGAGAEQFLDDGKTIYAPIVSLLSNGRLDIRL